MHCFLKIQNKSVARRVCINRCDLCVFQWNERDGDKFLMEITYMLKRCIHSCDIMFTSLDFIIWKFHFSEFFISLNLSIWLLVFRHRQIWYFDCKVNAIYDHIRTLDTMECNVHFVSAPISSNIMRSCKLAFGWYQNLIIYSFFNVTHIVRK